MTIDGLDVHAGLRVRFDSDGLPRFSSEGGSIGDAIADVTMAIHRGEERLEYLRRWLEAATRYSRTSQFWDGAELQARKDWRNKL